MKNRYAGVIVAEAIIIMLLIIGVAVLFVLLNRSTPSPSLPVMPTYDFPVSTATPVPTFPPAATSANTLPPGVPTQTLFPLFILNGTPVFPAQSNNSPARISSPVSSPISVSVWTYTPTRTPIVPPVSNTPTPSATASQVRVCRNVLYPMAVGQQWTYQASALSRTDTLNMSVLSVGNSQGLVTVSDQATGSTKQVQVQCEGDVIRSFPFMSVDVLFGNSLNSDMTATYISGVLAPNEAAFLSNNWALSWSSQYVVSGNTAINYNGTQVNVTLDNAPVTLTCQTLAAGDAAFETIAVAAGTFRALKVVCSAQGQVTAVVNGISVTGLIDGRSTQWFAPNVGLVKMQVTSATVQIFNIPFSLLTDNSLELKSYTQAP